MTTPDPQAQAYVRDQLAQGLEVTGEVAAPIYGDPAGADHPAQPMDLSKAQATAVDIEALLAQLQELQARAQEAVDAANPVPEPPDYSIKADPGAPSYVHDAFANIEKRLATIEAHVGL